MKYLIAGLGNIGDEYKETRHNAGFQVVDFLANKLEAQWKSASFGQIAEARHKGRTLILLKPNTYMNLSGKAVSYWMQKEKISLENILVILDEIQLEPGIVRLRGKGSDGGHNGLKDIQMQLNTTEYARLRVGVGKQFPPGGQVRYVLGSWSNEEKKMLPDILESASQAVLAFVSIGLQRAMESVNAKGNASSAKE
jgi:PTH1 family peptidyl-tRNA hydrolase